MLFAGAKKRERERELSALNHSNTLFFGADESKNANAKLTLSLSDRVRASLARACETISVFGRQTNFVGERSDSAKCRPEAQTDR